MGHRRIGGHGFRADGAEVTWSAAEGRRGTRWRETVKEPDGDRHVLLLELTSDGRPSRLEIGGSAGLLTLHPEPDASALHGNVVTAQGIVHLALPWGASHLLLTPMSPTAMTACLAAQCDELAIGGAEERVAIVVDADLRPRSVRYRIQRVADDGWRVAEIATTGRGPAPTWSDVLRGPEGGPLLAHASVWPLER